MHEHYLLTEQDIEVLRKFWKILRKDLSSDFLWGEKTYLAHAFRRYSDEYLYGGRDAARVASAVMILEMLYSTHQSAIVSQRAAKVLSHIGDNPLEIRNQIKEAYDIRNKFVHGAIPSTEINEKARLIRPKIFDIARKSIVAQLYLHNKESFIEIIDNSLLDSNAQADLKKLLLANAALMILTKPK